MNGNNSKKRIQQIILGRGNMKGYNELVRHSGNSELFQAVEMSTTAMANGHPFHIHAEGLRGTGKTTVMRAAAAILPPITRIRSCIYNCNPARPHCPDHQYLTTREVSRIGTETIARPFLEISHAAKIGTVVGSIDLGKLVDRDRPMAALLPGTILQAHRGVVFIDEINRLADTSPELADVLLDVMGTKPGRAQVEETGLPTVHMPVEVSVWAASNPDEDPGGLAQVRKQLADRFDLVVNMGRPNEYQAVLAILERRDGLLGGNNIKSTVQTVDFRKVTVDESIRAILAAIYVDFNLESLRAVEALETASRLAAVYSSRQNVLIDDIIRVTPLVLSHRTDNATLIGILRYLHSSGKVPEQRSSTTATAANPALPGQVDTADGKPPRSSWFSRILDSLQRKTSSVRTAQTAGSGDDNHKGQSRQYGGQSTAKSETIIDPTNSRMISPPHTAIALIELPVEQYVGGEDQKSHV